MSVSDITQTLSLLCLENPILPSHYDILLHIDPTASTVKGTARIEFVKNDRSQSIEEKDLKQFKLHAKKLNIKNACIVDERANKIQTLQFSLDESSDCVLFRANEPIVFENNRFCISIDYDAEMNHIKTHQDKTYGIFKTNFMKEDLDAPGSNNVIIATHCQPSYAKTIFPCVDEPSVKASIQLSIETLTKFKTISNMGVEKEEKTFDQNTLTTFKRTPLMNTSVFGFAIGDFDFIKLEVDMPISKKKIPISVYAPDNINFTVFTLDTIQKYLPILENYFNKEYPLDKLDFVLLPFLTDMAMENFGLVSILMNHLTLSPQALANSMLREQCQQLIVHELVHQWMGNFISFESWEHLWFNESFATWLACTLLTENGDSENYWTSPGYLQQYLYSTIETEIRDPNTLSITEQSKKSAVSTVSQTSDVFNAHSYAKGIAILRSLQLTIGDDLLKKGLTNFIHDEKNHVKSIKPMDIWTQVGKFLQSANIAIFFGSWTRMQGFPVVQVETIEDDGKIVYKLTQHRYYDGNQDEIEDIPFQIPLFILNEDGTLDNSNVLFTDRSLSINNNEKLVLLNHNTQGYFKVSYVSSEIYGRICEQLRSGNLNGTDFSMIMNDLDLFIGDAKYQKKIHLVGLLKLLETLCEETVELNENSEYWNGLNVGLNILEKFEKIESLGLKAKIFEPLLNKIEWPKDFNKLKTTITEDQLRCMSQLIFFNKENDLIMKRCDTYFQKLMMNESKGALIPAELVNSILSVYCFHMTSVKQWKKLIEIINNEQSQKTILNNIDHRNPISLDDLIIENIGLTTNTDLIKKNLAWMTQNISKKNIEKVLLGIKYNKQLINKDLDLLKSWYTTTTNTTINITLIILNIFGKDEQIVTSSNKEELWKVVQQQNERTDTMMKLL